ncbi:hypothetical protein EHS25_005498 [Saitozyma podzolica]|uniref:DUF5745 domain-containing protein n=1 Tax=Saitozyma podzolica TaxID=1890683 RepID=A0A427XYJ3_9TREE|nr:hypothetical protein EHS25_005498 [Saitozyma podzolica]
MPTPSLPLLHQLLHHLGIPVLPPSLSSTSPSLLLVILEALVDTKLPLPPSTRLCPTQDDEVSVVKCILGVLADDILAMDLTLVDPVRVVQGSELEIAVLVMALAVLAKRQGIGLSLPAPSSQMDRPFWLSDTEDDDPTLADLPPPISPDCSTSPRSLELGARNDVFGGLPDFLHTQDRHESARRNTVDKHATLETHFDMPVVFMPGMDTSSAALNLREHSKPSFHSSHSRSTTSNDRRRTVLQDMLEELGLGLAEGEG